MDALVLTVVSNSIIAFSFVLGLFTTILVIPPLMRLFDVLGLTDKPNARKIHDRPIARVGGIGIAVGVLIPTVLWAPYDPLLLGCLLAGLVILFGGIWDDCKPLSQKTKVLFQIVAIAITLHSGLLIEHVPFFGLDPVPGWVSYPLTFIFLLGITNATNLFDGLDGLAGGCVLLSLGMIALLSYGGAGGNVITLVALAMIGATLGFLRFNTHPASIFMGDAGSQILGFTAAVLSILLIEKTHGGLNFGLPLLILGLPILDTAMVIVLRLRSGGSPFRPDQRHIHHQLLTLGFDHASAVATLYVIQSFMVIAAYILRFQTDIMVVLAFLIVSALVLGSIYVARVRGVRVRGSWSHQMIEQQGVQWVPSEPLMNAVRHYLEYSVSVLFMFVGIIYSDLPYDIAVFVLLLAAALLFSILYMRAWAVFISRFGVYTVALLASFICFSLVEAHPAGNLYFNIFLSSLVICILFIILFDKEKTFQITPLDLLICILAISIPIFSGRIGLDFPIAKYALAAGIMIYASECIISAAPERHRILKGSALLTLILLGARAVW